MTHWPYQVYVGQWPIFYGPAILLHILKTYLMDKCCTWDNGSVWLKDQPWKIYVGQWPIFHGPLIYPCIIVKLKLFLYIKKWHAPGVFVPLRAHTLVSIAAMSIVARLKLLFRSWLSAHGYLPILSKWKKPDKQNVHGLLTYHFC